MLFIFKIDDFFKEMMWTLIILYDSLILTIGILRISYGCSWGSKTVINLFWAEEFFSLWVPGVYMRNVQDVSMVLRSAVPGVAHIQHYSYIESQLSIVKIDLVAVVLIAPIIRNYILLRTYSNLLRFLPPHTGFIKKYWFHSNKLLQI